MHSILFRIGPIPIYAYGFMLMLAFLAGSAVAVRLAKRRGIAPEHVLDMTALILVLSIVGARLLYVALKWQHFSAHPGEIAHIWEGGLSFHGGLAGGLLAGVIYCRRHGLPILRMGDVMMPGVALGYAIGRLGCFLNGCCYGAPTDLPWACRFPEPLGAGSLTAPSHPTQIYAAIISLGLFALLLWIGRHQRVDGQVLWTYLLGYAVYRFGIEFLRAGATAEAGMAGLTDAQWASIGMALLAGIALYRLSRRGAAVPGAGGKSAPTERRQTPDARRQTSDARHQTSKV
jgi:phosphatidylglycerol:prolipoprotein diacylglycerol transferase